MIFRRHVIPGAHKSPSIAKKMGTAAASVLLAKKLTRRWNFQFHWFGAVGVVILDLVDPSVRTTLLRSARNYTERQLEMALYEIVCNAKQSQLVF
jgi:hypothetical protein